MEGFIARSDDSDEESDDESSCSWEGSSGGESEAEASSEASDDEASDDAASDGEGGAAEARPPREVEQAERLTMEEDGEAVGSPANDCVPNEARPAAINQEKAASSPIEPAGEQLSGAAKPGFRRLLKKAPSAGMPNHLEADLDDLDDC